MSIQFNSTQEILDFAIEREREAARFYSELALRDFPSEVKKTFEDFVRVEIGHKKLLEGVKDGKNQLKDESVSSLQIAEVTEPAEISGNMTLVEVLAVAMKRELSAYRLYVELAAAATTPETLDIFVLLAQEEARHKLWLETEYKKLVENLVLNS